MSLQQAVEVRAAQRGYKLSYDEDRKRNHWFILDQDDVLVADAKGLFAINKVLLTLPNLITGEVPPPPPPPTVGWTEEHSTPLYVEHYKCPNYVVNCSCYQHNELVCYRSGCLRYAGCWGLCFRHSDLKMWGNLTPMAIEKTEKIKENGDWEEVQERNRTGNLPNPLHKGVNANYKAVQDMLRPVPEDEPWEKPGTLEDIALLTEMLDFEIEPSKYGNGYFLRRNGARVSGMLMGVHGLNTFLVEWIRSK